MDNNTKPRLKALHREDAYRVYLENGVLNLIDPQGNEVPHQIDLTLVQPLKAALGRQQTVLKLKLLVNVYDSKEAALNDIAPNNPVVQKVPARVSVDTSRPLNG